MTPSPGTTALTVQPTGSVTFYNNGAAIGSGTVNSSGIATRTTKPRPPERTGVYTATYVGDTNYLTSTTASSTSITATKATPTFVFFSNGSPTLQGLNVVFTIQLTNYSAQAGTVPYTHRNRHALRHLHRNPRFCSEPLPSSPTVWPPALATFSTTGLSAGTHTIYAVYAAATGTTLPSPHRPSQ